MLIINIYGYISRILIPTRGGCRLTDNLPSHPYYILFYSFILSLLLMNSLGGVAIASAAIANRLCALRVRENWELLFAENFRLN